MSKYMVIIPEDEVVLYIREKLNAAFQLVENDFDSLQNQLDLNGASKVYMERKNAAWSENVTITFSNEYLEPPSISANLIYDIGAANPGRTVPSNDLVLLVDLIIVDDGGTLKYTGCKIRSVGDSIPGSIPDGYISVLIMGEVE